MNKVILKDKKKSINLLGTLWEIVKIDGKIEYYILAKTSIDGYNFISLETGLRLTTNGVSPESILYYISKDYRPEQVYNLELITEPE